VTTDYVWEKLSNAVEALAASAEPIQVRVFHAAMAMVTLSADDFTAPDERARFTAIHERLTALTELADDRGSFEVTAESLSDEQAVRIAHDIAELHSLHVIGLLDRR
jgi:hypothetical protein